MKAVSLSVVVRVLRAREFNRVRWDPDEGAAFCPVCERCRGARVKGDVMSARGVDMGVRMRQHRCPRCTMWFTSIEMVDDHFCEPASQADPQPVVTMQKHRFNKSRKKSGRMKT
jgi:hypothetical protein